MRPSECIFGDAHAVQCELAGEVLRSSGKLRLGVTGWSMLPTLWPGDTLIIEQADSTAVSAGDIVLFARERRFFVHRVIASGAGRDIQTRGDAMPKMDPPVSDRELLGRVISIERNGRSIKPSRDFNPAGRAVAALVRHSPNAARVAVAMHEMLQSF
jgi:hypothetical protein